MKELKDIISGGTVDRDGMGTIEEILEQNKKLKDTFLFTESQFGSQYFSNDEALKLYLKQHKIVDNIIKLVRDVKKIESSKVLDIIFERS